MNAEEYNQMNAIDRLNVEAVRLIVENVVKVCEKHRKLIDGTTPAQWAGRFIGRLGMEPLFRLMFILMRTLIMNDVEIAEVMAQDPTLFIDCMAIGDLRMYYDQYPAAVLGP